MRYTYNITFVVDPSQEAKLMDFFKTTLIPKIFRPESKGSNLALCRVAEVGGEKPDPDHGLSIALALEFGSEKEAHQWHDDMLVPALETFTKAFSNEGVFFITLLEKLDLQ